MRSSEVASRSGIRRRLVLVTAALSGLHLESCSSDVQAPAAGFNVLLITLDTTRADRIGVYGDEHAVTPTLDGLAASGLLFTRAFSTNPTTLPAHASLFTGLYPMRHGARNNGDTTLSESSTTLAELALEQGYATAGFPAAIVLDRRYGISQGFDFYGDGFSADPNVRSYGGRLERPGAEVTDSLLSWLSRHDAERPFLAWAHYYDAHYPYAPPSAVAQELADDPYAGEIAYVDHHVGRLLEGIEQAGLRERTLVIVVGDHGEGLGDHGEDRHGCLLYDGVMRVPLILSCPGVIEPGLSEAVVSIVDVAPTLFELLGWSPGGRIDGRSLLAPEEGRAVYMETLLPLRNHGWAPLFGLRTEDEKFVLAPRKEYFDVSPDGPGEDENLWAADADGAAGIEARLYAVLGGKPQLEELLAGPGQDAVADPGLAALGYGGSDEPLGSELGRLDPKDVIEVAQWIDESRMLISRDAEAALRMVDRALARSPEDRSALQQQARVLIELRRWKEAESSLERFVAIAPSADALVMLAQVLLNTERADEIEPLLEAAERIEPGHGGIFTVRGDRALIEGDPAAAIEAYREALRVDRNRTTGSVEQRLERAKQLLRG